MGLRPGEVAPDLIVKDIDGNQITLSSLRGRVVLLDFMGVNCAPCRIEMPHLVATHDAYVDEGFNILSIDVGFPGLTALDATDARRFMEEFGARWPIALEGGNTAAITYGVTRIPTFYIIDRAGVVRVHPTQSPPIMQEQFAAWIEPLLRG